MRKAARRRRVPPLPALLCAAWLALALDRARYLWSGTPDCLARYDGVGYR